jgi:adenylosuccinate lyase
MDNISPFDNRYFDKVLPISKFFSLRAWINYRIMIEIKYLQKLIPFVNTNYDTHDLKYIDSELEKYLNNFLDDDENINDILNIEKTTKHDIKAIEYSIVNFIHNNMEEKYWNLVHLVHFGLTSQDINSMAFSLQLHDCLGSVIIPTIENIYTEIEICSIKWKDIVILGRTHGQPAVPTRMGKELEVYHERIMFWMEKIFDFKHYGKMGGAVGNLSAHYFAYPDKNWNLFFKRFVKEFGLIKWNKTTQIPNYEDITYLFSLLIGLNNVLLDLCQDIWLYISRNYFILEKEISEVGSSTMPQKINPINFENAEGNIKMVNSNYHMLMDKLSVSRLQRDLSDSTVLRNVGTFLAGNYLALKNILHGLRKLKINDKEIKKDLENHPECLSEAIQILLRKYNINEGYDIVRVATQNEKFNDLDEYKDKIISILKEKNINFPTLLEKINELNFYNY